jgi:hypothetical protein
MKKSITVYKIIGAFLVLCGIVGYFTVADEFRHSGELIGVTTILFAGIILLITDFKLEMFKNVALQWVAYCLLASIPFGGVILDNMPLGIGFGFALGIIAALLFGKKR